MPRDHTATLITGDPAPDFNLASTEGTPFRLATTLASGPVLLLFLRGAF